MDDGPSRNSRWWRYCAVEERLTKMMTDLARFPGVSKNVCRKASFCVTGTWRCIWCKVAGTASFSVSISHTNTGCCPGFLGIFLSARTSGEIVAEKSSVCRSEEGGRTPRHSSTSGSMLPTLPEARSRSASSSTTNRTLRSPEIESSPEVLMRSASRPGVAMTMWGRWLRAMAWATISAPPVTRMAFRVC